MVFRFCSQGLAGRGLPRALLLAVVLLLEVETISPGFAVPEASTTSLVGPADGGLNGVGPEAELSRSQGFGGLPAET